MERVIVTRGRPREAKQGSWARRGQRSIGARRAGAREHALLVRREPDRMVQGQPTRGHTPSASLRPSAPRSYDPAVEGAPMADTTKRGGFHALEQRIHQIEEEDAKQQQATSAPDTPQHPVRPPADEKRPDKKS